MTMRGTKMYELNLPNENPLSIFNCLTRNHPLMMQLYSQEMINTVNFFDEIYRIKGSTASLYTLPTCKITFRSTTTKDEMEKLYNNRLVKSKGGKIIYQSIMNSAINKTCPLCSLRLVSTLDHYLPKAHYPQYAISRKNLYPACIECNKSKLDTVSSKKAEQTFHPYFDTLRGVNWLLATYHSSPTPKLVFYINNAVTNKFYLRDRMEFHFKKLSLGELYSTYAANELASIKYNLQLIYEKKGSNGMRRYLHKEYISASAVNKNSWKTVFYLTLSNSSVFCSSGFNNISDIRFP